MIQLKGFNLWQYYFECLKIESEDKTNYDSFYSSLKAEIMINESDRDNVFKSIYTRILTNIQKSLGKGSGWIID